MFKRATEVVLAQKIFFPGNSLVTTDKIDHKEDKSNFMPLSQLVLKHAKLLCSVKDPFQQLWLSTLTFYVFIRCESQLRFVVFFGSLWQ